MPCADRLPPERFVGVSGRVLAEEGSAPRGGRPVAPDEDARGEACPVGRPDPQKQELARRLERHDQLADPLDAVRGDETLRREHVPKLLVELLRELRPAGDLCGQAALGGPADVLPRVGSDLGEDLRPLTARGR